SRRASRAARARCTLRCGDCSLHGTAVRRAANPWPGVPLRRARRLLPTPLMRISDVLPVELVVPAIAGRTKDEVLDALVGHMAAFHPSLDLDRLATALRERERQMS